ncbi:MAG: glycosyltransferase family 2 protein [Thermoleophilaceae bacterium]
MNVFVVPAYNEEDNLPRLIDDLESRPELWEGGRVIVVDDGSEDGTADVAVAHPGPLPIEVIRLEANQGPGRAFDLGFRRALEIAPQDGMVVTLEADTTSDLDAVHEMLATARSGADVVLASHHDGGELVNVRAHRRFLSRAAAYAVRRTAGLDARTVSSFFRVYRAAALRAAYALHGTGLIREGGFACKAELLIKLDRMHARVAEVPVALDWSRREGASKLRVLPTVGGYARLMVRQATARERV